MCWNKEVSLFSFGVISLVSYKLYTRNLLNDRFLAIFIMSYGTMQLFETFIWYGLDTNNRNINFIGSILACLLLYLHPIAIMYGMRYDNLYKKYINTRFFKLLTIIAYGFAIFGIFSIFKSINDKSYDFISYPDRINHHLIWDFPSHYPYIVFFGLIALIFMLKENKTASLFIVLYYLLPALYVIVTNKVSIENLNKNYIGSYWCWYVAIFSFILYIINPYIQKDKL